MLSAGTPSKHIHIHMVKCYIHHKFENEHVCMPACVGESVFCFWVHPSVQEIIVSVILLCVKRKLMSV